MKKTKRTLSLLVVVALLASLLAGCGNTPSTSNRQSRSTERDEGGSNDAPVTSNTTLPFVWNGGAVDLALFIDPKLVALEPEAWLEWVNTITGIEPEREERTNEISYIYTLPGEATELSELVYAYDMEYEYGRNHRGFTVQNLPDYHVMGLYCGMPEDEIYPTLQQYLDENEPMFLTSEKRYGTVVDEKEWERSPFDRDPETGEPTSYTYSFPFCWGMLDANGAVHEMLIARTKLLVSRESGAIQKIIMELHMPLEEPDEEANPEYEFDMEKIESAVPNVDENGVAVMDLMLVSGYSWGHLSRGTKRAAIAQLNEYYVQDGNVEYVRLYDKHGDLCFDRQYIYNGDDVEAPIIPTARVLNEQ